jgi:hypothetical protein
MKNQFYTLSSLPNPVTAVTFFNTVNDVMTDIHHENWLDDVYQQVSDPDEHGQREAVNDVLTRCKDLMACYKWALVLTGKVVPSDLEELLRDQSSDSFTPHVGTQLV